MNQDAVAAALRELQQSVDRIRTDLAAKEAEISKLRESLAERDGRIRALGEQTTHLLELIHEQRVSQPGSVNQTPINRA